jgi:hypothetical protein
MLKAAKPGHEPNQLRKSPTEARTKIVIPIVSRTNKEITCEIKLAARSINISSFQ